jgi:hypothetical protein
MVKSVKKRNKILFLKPALFVLFQMFVQNMWIQFFLTANRWRGTFDVEISDGVAMGSFIGSRMILFGALFDMTLNGFSFKIGASGGGDLSDLSGGVVELGLFEASSERWPESLSWLLWRESSFVTPKSELDIVFAIVSVESCFVNPLSVSRLESSSSSSLRVSFP